jgi:hypothetical protein
MHLLTYSFTRRMGGGGKLCVLCTISMSKTAHTHVPCTRHQIYVMTNIITKDSSHREFSPQKELQNKKKVAHGQSKNKLD